MIFLTYREGETNTVKIPALKRGMPDKFLLVHSASMQQYLFPVVTYSESGHQYEFNIQFESVPFSGQYNYTLYSKGKKLSEGLLMLTAPKSVEQPQMEDFYFDNEQTKPTQQITEEDVRRIIAEAQQNGTDAWIGTKEEYDALTVKDPDVWYYITDEFINFSELQNKPKIVVTANGVTKEFTPVGDVTTQRYELNLDDFSFMNEMKWDYYETTGAPGYPL